MKKIALLLCIICLFLFSACNTAHDHNPTTNFEYDSSTHWQECEICSQKLNKENHSFSDWTQSGINTLSRSCACGYSEAKETSQQEQPKEEDNKQVNDLFIYESDGDSITILKFIGYDNDVQIPTEIDNLPVLKIASGSFIRTTTLPIKARKTLDSTEQEDNKSNNLCVYIPESVEYIENGSFEENTIFITSAKNKKENWHDEAIGDSATEENSTKGNVHYGYTNGAMYTEQGLRFVYNEHQKGYFLATCLRQNKNVTIPSYINGKPVVHIGQGAFKDNKKIEKVEIPETIGYIWSNAFANCTALETIIAKPGNLSKIRSGSFMGCISLKEVILPSFVTVLGPNSFADCGVIEKITIPVALISINSNAFLNTTVKQIDYLGSEENYQNLYTNSRGNEGFLSAKINFLGANEFITINSLEQLNTINYGAIVEIEGYVALYSRATTYIFLINEDNTCGVEIYLGGYKGKIYPKKGDKVKIIGAWAKYTGQNQIASVESISVIEENAMTAQPIEVTIEDVEANPTFYQCKYLLFTGIVHHSINSPKTTYFTLPNGNAADMFLFGAYLPESENSIQFHCSLIAYNGFFELTACADDLNNLLYNN